MSTLVADSEDSEASEKEGREADIQERINHLADSYLKGSPLFIASARYLDLPKQPFKRPRRSAHVNLHKQNADQVSSSRHNEVSAWLKKTKSATFHLNGTPCASKGVAGGNKKRRRQDDEPALSTAEANKKNKVLTISEKSNVEIKQNSVPLKPASKGTTKPKNLEIRDVEQKKGGALKIPPNGLSRPPVLKKISSTSAANESRYPKPSSHLEGNTINISTLQEPVHAGKIDHEAAPMKHAGPKSQHVDDSFSLPSPPITEVQNSTSFFGVGKVQSTPKATIQSPQHSASPPPPATIEHSLERAASGAYDKRMNNTRRKSLGAIESVILSVPKSSPIRSSPARMFRGPSNSGASNCSPGSSFQSFDIEENLHDIEAFLEQDVDWRNDLPKEVLSDSE